MGRILVDAFNRTDHHALGLIEMTDTFGAAFGMNDINFFTLGNGLIRTGRFADIAVDAQGVDQECHSSKPKRPGKAEPRSGISYRLLDFFEQEAAAGSFNRGFHTLGIFRFADEQNTGPFNSRCLGAGECFCDEIGHGFAIR